MAMITKKKLAQDIIKSIKIAPFSEALMATAAHPNFNVQVTNLKTNQTVPVVQKEPVAAVSWHPKKNILVSIGEFIQFQFKNQFIILLAFRWLGITKRSALFICQINSLN